MRKHSLLNFTPLRVVYFKYMCKAIVRQFSMFGKEILPKKGKKEGNVGA